MDKCEKCGMNLNDDCIVVWKCPECGKAFKVRFSKLQQIQEWKRKNVGKHLIKCSSCGSILDDRTNNAEIDPNNSYPDMIECPECGKKILKDSKLCSYCGYPLEEKEEEKNNLIKCPECGKEIPKNIKECLFCGYPIRKLCTPNFIEKIIHSKKHLFIVAVSIFLFVVLCMLFNIYKKHDLDEKINEGAKSIFEPLDIGMQNEKSDIEDLMNNFFEELQSGNLDNTQQYLAEECDYVKSNPFGLSTKENVGKLLEHYDFSLMDLAINDERDAAFVNIEINHPNQTELLDAAIANFSLSEENSIENGFMNKLNDSNLEYTVTNGSINLVKVDDEWRINVDNLFTSCVFFGISEETSFEKMAENQKKQAEKDSYIKEMIDLVDYNVGMMEGYLGAVPGIKNISIKNNGDKQIDSLTLGIDFLDETGSISYSEEITVLGTFDDSISGGYSWKMEKDKFFEIKNVPDNVNLNRVIVSITDAELSDVKVPSQKTPEEEYIEQNVEITDYYIGMQSGYRGKEPGISDISIKNNGDKDIAQLTITVYFQDENGKNIAEDSFMIIGGLFGGDTLKANYSWKMEKNKYYEFKNLADEVDISQNSVKVTEIKFE